MAYVYVRAVRSVVVSLALHARGRGFNPHTVHFASEIFFLEHFCCRSLRFGPEIIFLQVFVALREPTVKRKFKYRLSPGFLHINLYGFSHVQ